MRRKLPNQTKPNQSVVTKMNLLVLNEEENELIEQGDETEAAKPNQPLLSWPNLLVLDDEEHELIEQGDEMEATRQNQTNVL